VSPVFRHGRLRLYLLKLLDESPRHGYEVIRLLQDRFMGVYAPSPGTIYPRLARLEEDGLVTHEEVDGKKVYSITDKGREEIRSRLGDLADLEDELTESLRDVAREISEDVRDTVRTIREELASAAREFRAEGGKATRPGTASSDASDEGADRESWGRAAGDGDTPDSGATGETGSAGGSGAETRRIREEARRNRDQMRARFRAQGRSHGDWAAWATRTGRDWSAWSSWADWAGFREDAETGDAGRDKPSQTGPGSGERAGSAQDSASGAGERSRRGGPNPFTDLERMAMQFASELRAAAKHTGDLGERSLSDLRDILTDTLARVRTEVFADSGPAGQPGAAHETGSPAGQSGKGAAGADESADASDKPAPE
jgi:DNA-binding PadR family transcriptional regulator